MKIPALLLGLTLSLSAQARVVDSSANGFTVQNEVLVKATPRQAWDALVDDVDRWWPRDHTWFGKNSHLSIDAKPGGCFCEVDESRQVLHMTVAFVDPEHLLRMIGGLGPMQGMGLSGALDWSFESTDGGTRITLRYRVGGYSPDDLTQFAPVVDKVQQLQLGGLAHWLDPTP